MKEMGRTHTHTQNLAEKRKISKTFLRNDGKGFGTKDAKQVNFDKFVVCRGNESQQNLISFDFVENLSVV